MEVSIRADFGRIGPISDCQHQAVVELLLSQSAARGAGEPVRIALTGVGLPAGTLIRTAARDRADQEFQVEIMGDELTDEFVEHFRMARWVVHGCRGKAVHGVTTRPTPRK